MCCTLLLTVGGVLTPTSGTAQMLKCLLSTHGCTTAIMKLIRLEATFIFGIVIPQIFSVSSPASNCLASVDTCMSDLCKSEQALNSGVCGDEGCQMKGSEVCNMTIQTALDQFPSLRGCVCSWEVELCDSIQALATQCHRKPAAQQKRSTVVDWQSSSLIGLVYNGAGSCIDQMLVCISDAVCNRYLAPFLQACTTERCNLDSCQRATQQFYGSMPLNVAEMLVLCECEASDQSCLQMKSALQGSTCGDETWICQDTVQQCVENSACRELLKTFQTKCWSSEEAQCSVTDLQIDECFTKMDPALILGADSECKMAFISTLGTTLQYPCTCQGLHSDDLLQCDRIHDVFHNKSHFVTPRKSSSGPSKPPETNESEQGHSWPQDYLLYAFATVLLVGVVIVMPLAVVSKIWILRRRDKTKFHHPQRSNCVVVF